MSRAGWVLALLLCVIAALSCVIRVASFNHVNHPGGETQTDITVEKGTVMLWRLQASTNASPTTIRRSILNRQVEIGFRPRYGFRRTSSTIEVTIPLAAIALGASALIAAELLRRRLFAAVPVGHCRCGYALAGLGPSGTCPECGRRYGNGAS